MSVTISGNEISLTLHDNGLGVSVVGQQGPAGPPVPAGTATRVLFSDGSAVDTDADFTYDKVNNRLTLLRLASATGAQLLLAPGGLDSWYLDPTTRAFKPYNSNSFDLGATTETVRNGYFGTKVFTPAIDIYPAAPGNALITANTNTSGPQFQIGNNVIAGAAGQGLVVEQTRGFLFCNSGQALGNFDAGFYRGGVGIVEQRHSTTAQTFRMYESFTDAANYSRLSTSYNGTALSFHIAAQAAGTGTLRGLILDGTLVLLATSGTTRYSASATDFSPYTNTGTDNTLNLGKSGTRWKTGHFGTSVNTPLVSSAGDLDLGATGATQLRVRKDVGIFPITDNALDLGFSGSNRIRAGYFGTSVVVPFVKLLNTGFVAWNTSTPGLGLGSLHLGEGGSATAFSGPAITFGARDSGAGDTAQAGIYSISDATLGTELYLASGGSYVNGAQMALKLDTAQNVHVWKLGAAFYAWNTRTDASNYDRARFGFVSNVLVLGTEAAGTGTQRALRFNAANIEIQFAGTSRWLFDNGPVTLRPIDDNTNDIGTAAQRIKAGYFVTVSASNISASSGITSSTFGVTGVASGYNVNRRDNNNLGFQLYSGAGELNFYSGVAAAVKATLSANGDFAASGAITTTGGGIGYATGAGGTVTQLTSKSTAVTLNKLCGEITMNAGSLAANTPVQFTLSNSVMGANDNMVIQHVGGGTLGAYSVVGACGGGAGTINVRNLTAGALAEAIVLRFTIIKSVNS